MTVQKNNIDTECTFGQAMGKYLMSGPRLRSSAKQRMYANQNMKLTSMPIEAIALTVPRESLAATSLVGVHVELALLMK